MKVRNIKIGFAILALVGASVHCKLFAQLSAIHAYNRIDTVLVMSETNDTLRYPFAGGLNSCQLMNIDMNLDGIDDLLVFDRHGNRLLPFLVSAASTPGLVFSPDLVSSLPSVEQWIQTLDYNNDGKKDIFTYTTGGIKVFRNDSDSQLRFTQVTKPFLLSQQGSTLTNILVTSVDYPAIADIDSDGDYDVLSFWGLGSFIEWHRNTSVERFGNADSLTFERSSSCWGHFAEGNEDNTIVLDTCVANGGKKSFTLNSDDPKHTGSTMLVQDMNADGLPDITLGDVDFSTLILLTNGGTAADARMVSATTNYPNSLHPVKLTTFPAAMLADVNNDGKRDLLVSSFDPSLIKGDNYTSIHLYLNNGSNVHPDFVFVTKSFIQDQMLDMGSGAYPLLFDYNGDGLMDLLVGNYGYSDTCIYDPLTGLQCTFISKIALLINEGTKLKPQFRLIDRNIANLDLLQMQSLIPAMADMDGDGDMDLVCGNSKGKFVYCENNALPGQPAHFELVDPAWHGIDAGDFSAPQLFDLDNDGLTDLICGKRNGTLSFYKNTGTLQEARFTLVTELLGGVDVTDTERTNYGYSVPCFYKQKANETLLFVGSEFGEVYVYDQINNNLEGTFRLIGALPGLPSGLRSGITIGNLNNDTLTDLLVGNYSGGLGLFYGKPEKVFGINDAIPASTAKLVITPNPASDKVSVSVISDLPIRNKSMAIKSVDGKVIRLYPETEFPFLLDISAFANGIYLVLVQTNLGLVSGKFVVCW